MHYKKDRHSVRKVRTNRRVPRTVAEEFFAGTPCPFLSNFDRRLVTFRFPA
jgi:hypothetical protein